jgi:hypothetical protein
MGTKGPCEYWWFFKLEHMIYNIIQTPKDSLQQKTISKVAEVVSENSDVSISFWFWIALLEFLIIALLIYRLRKRSRNLDFSDLPEGKLKSAKSANIDMGNLMNSINGSKDIYKELSRLCHPDRFINTDKHNNALLIFQEVSKNKRNYKELSNLRERAITELEIKIN